MSEEGFLPGEIDSLIHGSVDADDIVHATITFLSNYRIAMVQQLQFGDHTFSFCFFSRRKRCEGSFSSVLDSENLNICPALHAGLRNKLHYILQ
uniref:Uncharacterized protein n=1 Tax=Romanomermis culicivorax TaxID=13658 RepID=A0A915HW91_ROMCU